MFTLVGDVADRHGDARNESGLMQLPAGEYEARQKKAPLLVDHTAPVVGRLEHLELTADGQLRSVASFTGRVDLTGTWRYSPGVAYQADPGDIRGDHIRIRELSMTRNPASVGLRPIRVLDGDFRDPATRARWRLSGTDRAMLERASLSVYDRGLTIHGIAEARERALAARHQQAQEQLYDEMWRNAAAAGGPLIRSGGHDRIIGIR